MRRAGTSACLLAVALALALTGCGEDPAKGLAGNVDKAHTAAAIAALQTSLVTAATVQADAPAATAENLVPALQAKDPTNRYTTATPTGAGIVQVAGGGGGAVMLIAVGSPVGSGGPPSYVAVWQGSGATMYYVGSAPPAYSASPPSGTGWSATLPQ
jgi:hypothetical protein